MVPPGLPVDREIAPDVGVEVEGTEEGRNIRQRHGTTTNRHVNSDEGMRVGFLAITEAMNSFTENTLEINRCLRGVATRDRAE